MALSVVQHVAAGSGGSTSQVTAPTITAPTSTNRLVVFVGCHNTIGTITLSDGAGSALTGTYGVISNGTFATSGTQWIVWETTDGNTGTDTVIRANQTNSTGMVIAVVELSGTLGQGAVDFTNSGDQTAGVNGQTTVAEDAVFVFAQGYSSVISSMSFTTGSPWTALDTVTASSGVNNRGAVMTEWQDITTGGSPGNWTYSGSGNTSASSAIMLAVKGPSALFQTMPRSVVVDYGGR